jgi:hypothetical protein
MHCRISDMNSPDRNAAQNETQKIVKSEIQHVGHEVSLCATDVQWITRENNKWSLHAQ